MGLTPRQELIGNGPSWILVTSGPAGVIVLP